MTDRISAERLRELLIYDPKTGVFTNKMSRGARAQAGGTSGWRTTRNSGFYTRIKLDSREYEASNLAFLYMTGEWPSKRIDHKDNDGENNSWENLREATVGQNRANTHTLQPNGTGRQGVRYYPGRRKPYHARLTWEGRLHSLGYYETIEEASAAHDAKAAELWGEFAPSSLGQVIASATKVKPDQAREFQLILARLIHRYDQRLDIAGTIAQARDLLARKGTIAPSRSRFVPPTPATAPTTQSDGGSVDV